VRTVEIIIVGLLLWTLATLTQPAPYVSTAAPAFHPMRVYGLHQGKHKRWLTSYDHVILATDKGLVLVYYNAADQLVIVHLGERYIVPSSEGYPGNMAFLDLLTFDEKAAREGR
jgi:hypothetical protein